MYTGYKHMRVCDSQMLVLVLVGGAEQRVNVDWMVTVATDQTAYKWNSIQMDHCKRECKKIVYHQENGVSVDFLLWPQAPSIKGTRSIKIVL